MENQVFKIILLQIMILFVLSNVFIDYNKNLDNSVGSDYEIGVFDIGVPFINLLDR